MPVPKHSILFYKPVTAVTGPFDVTPIATAAWDPGLDYGCGLVAVIGKEGPIFQKQKPYLT